MTWTNVVNKLSDGTLTIGGDEIPIKQGQLKQATLNFYAENPRLYSVLGSEFEMPDQDKIQKELNRRDHVKQLRKDIEINGGLLEPIIVLDSSYEVLEGNCRLAAYRELARKNPSKWGKIKCQILPGHIEEAHIFTILGQLHIRGKKDWDKFEQAGYLWRRHHKHGVDIKKLAQSIGLSANEVGKQIAIYQFMQDHNEKDIRKWSYYEVYFSNQGVKRARKEYSDLDKIVVKQIQKGKVGTAQEFRTKIGAVSKNKKAMKNYAGERHDLDASYNLLEKKGLTSTFGQQMKRFQAWSTDGSRKAELREHLRKGKATFDDAKYRIGKISRAVEAWEAIIEKVEKS